MKLANFIFLLSICLACNPASEKPTSKFNSEATATLDQLEVMEGFEVSLFATEPLVADPVDMEIDENGDLYVVEMHGYPLDLNNSGIIKKLIDTDQDGIPDKFEVFADGLKLPTGIMRWKDGFIVTDAPDVLYLEDTDGDGKADKKEVILTGFALSNPQHNLNSPTFGLDNWIYLGHERAITPFVHTEEFGDEGSIIEFKNVADSKKLGKNADGKMVRFKLDDHQLEALSGETQFGHTTDAWGHRIYTHNADHLFHEAIAAEYLNLNPNLLVPDAMQYIPDYGNTVKVYPITENPNHQLLTDVGVITSSCGVTWYNGHTFGDQFNNVTFIAEPVHNLVHADVIEPKGATFTAKRLLENKEFLASKDPWFRPVNFYVGPDGALYVLDYYRQIIEHPEWMSDEVNQSGALYNGKDKGRIYRITPKNNTESSEWLGNLQLAQKSPNELAELLDNPNGWYRQITHRLLYQDLENLPTTALQNLLKKAENPEAKIPAMWLLQEGNALPQNLLVQLLQDPVAGVRENTIKLAEVKVRNGETLSDEVIEQLTALQNDTNAQVRYQLLCSSGYIKKLDEAARTIAFRDLEDSWVSFATIATHVGKEALLLDQAITALGNDNAENKGIFFEALAATIANSGNKKALEKIIHYKGTDEQIFDWQAHALSGINQLWQYKSPTVELSEVDKNALLQLIKDDTSPNLSKEAINLLGIVGFPKNNTTQQLIAQAKQTLEAASTDSLAKLNAVTLLSHVEPAKYKETFLTLVKENEEFMQVAAMKALRQEADDRTCNSIIDNFESFSSIVQSEAIALLTSEKPFILLLLEAIEQGKIPPSKIGWKKTVSLLNYYDENIRNYARELLAINEDRKAVLQNYLPAADMKGDVVQGKALFTTLCATCHQAEGIQGVEFGPNLATLQSRNVHSIITEIIHPNNSIADQYEQWEIELKNGKSLSGIIAQENAQQITLTQMGGQKTIINKADISQRERATRSAMPDGFENSISLEQMANLVAFIKQVE